MLVSLTHGAPTRNLRNSVVAGIAEPEDLVDFSLLGLFGADFACVVEAGGAAARRGPGDVSLGGHG